MGRRQFEQTVASVPREKLMFTQISKTTAVAAGGSEIVDVFAPMGTVGRIQSMWLDMPPAPGASTGTHEIALDNGGGGFLLGVSVFGSRIEWNRGHWMTADSAKFPPSDAAQATTIKDILFDDVNGIYWRYENKTNAAATAQRSYFLSWVKSDAAK